MSERNVKYFDKPGKANTEATIGAVRSYLNEGNAAAAVIVASISGETALKVKKELGEILVPVLCVTGSACWQIYPEYEFPLVSEAMRGGLETAGVRIVDSVPSTLSETIECSFARYGFRSPTWILVETLLAVGGYGLKTAVECILMATDGGYVPPFKEVIAIAGTGKGADTAIVARSSFSLTAFSSSAEERFVLNEILAMPRNKSFYKNMKIGEWEIDESK